MDPTSTRRFISLVFDHTGATVLNFTSSVRAIHDQADPDDLDNAPIFNTASECLDNGPIFDEEQFITNEFYSDLVVIAAFVHKSCDPSHHTACP
jgi:hypothetical protein